MGYQLRELFAVGSPVGVVWENINNGKEKELRTGDKIIMLH